MLNGFQPYSIDSVSRYGIHTAATINEDLVRLIVNHDVGGQDGSPVLIICRHWLGNGTSYDSQIRS